MGAINYEFPFTICLIFYFWKMKWGQSICINYTRGDICVKFATEACQLALSALDQLSLNLHNALVRRKKGGIHFQGSSFEQDLTI
jgi:hypothetical protein